MFNNSAGGQIRTECRPVKFSDREGLAIVQPDRSAGGLCDMPQRDDIGAVDAHEAVGRQLFDEVFQAVEDDDRRLRIDQEDLDIFAHALHIEDLADIDAEGPVVRLEVGMLQTP